MAKRQKQTFENGTELPNQGHSSRSKVLTNGNFLKENWNSTKYHCGEIDYEKGTCNKENKGLTRLVKTSVMIGGRGA